MHITQNCPHCGKPLRLAAEHAGRLIRCPGCSETFRVGATEPPAEAAPLPRPPKPSRPEMAIVEELPRATAAPPAPRPAFPPAWGLVRQALNLVHYGILINVLGTVLAIAFMLGMGALAPDMPGKGRGFFIVFVIGVLAVLGVVAMIAFFMIQIGLGCCCCAPHESKARGLAIAALMVSLNSWPLLFLSRIAESGFRADYDRSEGSKVTLLPFTMTIATLTGVAVTVLFVLFLRQLARHFANTRLAANIRAYLIFYLVVVGLFAFLGLGSVLLTSTLGSSSPRTQRVSGWETEEERWERQQRLNTHDDDSDWFSGTLGIVVALAVVAVVLLFAGVNIVWLLDIIRRTRDTIGKAEKAALTGPIAAGD